MSASIRSLAGLALVAVLFAPARGFPASTRPVAKRSLVASIACALNLDPSRRKANRIFGQLIKTSGAAETHYQEAMLGPPNTVDRRRTRSPRA